jgi:protein TonB
MRLYTIVVSIAAHAAILVVLVIVPLAAVDALPVGAQMKAWIVTQPPVVPELPPPPGRRAPSVSDAPGDVAPIAAPDRIDPEPPAGGPVGVGFDGPPGVPSGTDGAILGAGVTLGVAPPPVSVKPIRPGGDIQAPTKIKHVPPVYPPIARSAGIRGTVILEAVIAEDGRVRDVRVLRSITLLDPAAVDAVRQWQFTPTRLNGIPVPVVMTVTVTFELH